ncbi:hypothetical protein JQX13_05665 [Archangium violaceum]|nr:hypothetical protein JQX13_05665 [Archangium violaceum]
MNLWTWMQEANRTSGHPIKPIAGTEFGWTYTEYGPTLTAGRRYTLSAYARGSGDTARLRALGFNTLNGVQEASTQVAAGASYQPLTVSFTPNSNSVVISLESNGSGTVYFDDVTLTEAP